MDHLEFIGTRGYFRPAGQVTVEQAIDLVAEAIRTARAQGLNDILVDTTGLSGFGNPGVIARYSLGSAWAAAAGSQFIVAVVVRRELIDPQKIGAVVAQNRNAILDVFPSEAEALAWLNARGTRTWRTRDSGHEGGE